ncbi:hypothetical protein CO608_08855 [Lysobacteraceae bacterium NML08-0793]|nr:hypothetical protein CO608_08855 [Xanthomonadaceae bacterium NML08-0793]
MALYEIEKSNLSFFEEKTGISGDFASLLWEGEVEFIEPDTVNVRRFGPDVPRAYLHFSELMVTQEIKKVFDKELKGFSAIRANKKKIINADWMNLKQDFFDKYFSFSDAISKGKHDPEAASKMPDLWLIAPDFPLNFKKMPDGLWEFDWQDESDFYYGSGDRLGMFVSEKARDLMTKLGDLLVFSELQTKPE